MALTASELATLARLQDRLESTRATDELLLAYYQGRQRVEQLGMAIPPAMRRFLVIANWPRVVVDGIVERQQVSGLILPGEETADPRLRDIWDASNLTAHLQMFNRDRCIYGRAFMSVGSNEDDPSLPLIRVESPLEFVVDVDVRRERATAAARFFGKDDNGDGPTHATLLLPDVTVWAQRGPAGWVEVGRDQHMLGAVPVIMHLNRRTSAAWVGESQMADVIPLADSAARALTNLQFAQEAHGIPRMFMTGVSKGDFVDGNGKPVPQFEAYFDAIHMLTKADAKVGQLTPADLANFETAVTMYAKQAATVTGFPASYFGISTANPAAEGAIVAEERRLVRSVESQNEEVGMSLGWAAALALRIATGEWIPGNRVKVNWFNPATPTLAQRMDAIVKAKATGILSREGAWDELGWSEARKERERAYFETEGDPLMAAVLGQVNGGAGVGAGG